MTIISNIRVGKPDVEQDASAHTPGVRQGNTPRPHEPSPGKGDAKSFQGAKENAGRSTGINADSRNPIDRSAPNLSPA